MPSLFSAFSDEYAGSSYGASIKTFDFARRRAVSLTSFEGGYEIIPAEGRHRVTVTGMSIFGLLNPGIAVDMEDGETSLYAVGEIDIFYFPFAFFSIIAFERPVFIPSVYVRALTDFRTVEAIGGMRVSFPLYGMQGS